MEALASNATFVARSFAGDPKQLKELLKIAIAHNGIAVIDIISPCVTFHNHEHSFHSYSFGKSKEEPLHEISFVPARDEITIEDFEEGTSREVTLHDGSTVVLKKLENDYDPQDKAQAFKMLAEALIKNELVTGLIYINPNVPNLFDQYNLPDEPLNRTRVEKMRPAPENIDLVNSWMF
jgi:2-oxoglutarate ferredoxin oxidoreductase subunit beta